MATTTPFPKNALCAIRAIAAVAMALCVYLLAQKMGGKIDSLVGCGGEGGCAQMLGGRWSAWFGIPVTLFAGAMYLVVLIAAMPRIARRRPSGSSLVLRAAAVLAGGAALWFFGILFLVEKTFCPYCTAVHACGLAFTAVMFFTAGRALPSVGAAPYAIGLIGLVLLAAGQLIAPPPDTHQLAEITPGNAAPASDAVPTSDLQFAGGRIRVSPDAVPAIGPDEPEHYIVELFDYTCKNCRNMHGDIKALQKAHPGTFTILYLPCPLNRKCNRFLRSGIKGHPDACELARAALAVWHAEPEKFAAIHDYLMTTALPLRIADAEAKAISLVGETAFREAQRAPAIDSLLATTFSHYRLLAQDNPRMPLLLLGGDAVLRGTAKDSKTFIALMAEHFRLGEAAE